MSFSPISASKYHQVKISIALLASKAKLQPPNLITIPSPLT